MKWSKTLLATFITVLSIGLFVPSSASAQSLPSISINELNIQVHETLTGTTRTYADVSPNWFNYFTHENYSEIYNTDYVGVYEKIAHIDNDAWGDLDALDALKDTLSVSYGYTVLYETYSHSTTIFAHLEPNTKSSIRSYSPGTTSNYLAFDKDVFRIQIRPQGSSSRPYNVVSTDLVSPTDTEQERSVFAILGHSGVYADNLKKIFFSNTEFDPANSIAPWNTATESPFNEDNIHDQPITKTPVWLNYSVKIVEGKKMIIQSENWTDYRDKHGGGIRYGDVGGTSDITVCRIEDKDNTGCIDTVAFVPNQSGRIHLEYPEVMIGEVGYYKVFIDNSNKEPKIPPFDYDDAPFDVKNRSMIVFNDGNSTVAIDTVGYYEDEPYFPQYDDNVYYNKFMNHNLVDDHGLIQVLLAPIGYLSELPKVTCQPLNLPMPSRFGEDINLPCMTESVYQSQFPEIFRIYQLIVTAIFSYLVGLRLFQNIKEMSSEKDDSIEVVRL